MSVASKTYAVGEVLLAGTLNTYSRDNLADLQSEKMDCKTGTYTGDGNASQAVTGLGITPKYLVLWEQISVDETACDRWETNDSIVDNNVAGICYVINDSGNVSMQTDAIVSLESGGFTVGLGGGSPNANTKVVEYMAFGS